MITNTTDSSGSATPSSAVGPVVVGVDGSPISLDAARWAALEASERGVELQVICAWESYVGALSSVEGLLNRPDLFEDDTQAIVQTALATIAKVAPELAVSTSTPFGRPSHPLLEASAQASLVVVGNRGRGRLAEAILGTTTLQVASHASCPVVVVPAGATPSRRPRRVVVGVDGSPPSSGAVRFAVSVAGDGGHVEVIHAWWLEVVDGVVVTTPQSQQWHSVTAKHEAMLQEMVGELPSSHPQVRMVSRSQRGRAATVLSEAANQADLLVVGSRGRGGFADLLLGSVTQRLLTATSSPVAVVHDESGLR